MEVPVTRLVLALLLTLSPGIAVAGQDSSATEQADWLEMEVVGVMPTELGHAVILADPHGTVMMPIWIGETEAISISLRAERRRFERPLTHDLVDAVLEEFGARIIAVHIDALKTGTFVATFDVQSGKKKKRVKRIDARASDAIALALGADVPILVHRSVVEEAGMTEGDLEEAAVEEQTDQTL